MLSLGNFTDFSEDEVQNAILSLKPRKSPGSDSIEPEHILFGGESLISLLACIFSAIVRAGRLPDSLCHGLIIPIPKGPGKDLTNPSNYWGI